MSDAPYRDAPYRDAVDPLGPRLHQRVVRRDRASAQPPVRLGLSAGLLGLSGVYALAGELVAGASVAVVVVVATAGAAIDARARRARYVVDVHEHGLRVDAAILWADVDRVTIDRTPDQGARPATLTIATRETSASFVGRAADLAPLLADIEAGVGVRHHREAEARLQDLHAISFGRHGLTSYGLHAGDASVPWRDLGPTRRVRGQLVVETPVGEVATPIGGVENPWAIERLIAARGRSG